MDASALLEEACRRAALTQTDFAARGGTSRATLTAYLSGRSSPSVRTLNRLLAAAGFQVRAVLEPWLADVDERVDSLLAGVPAVDLAALERLASGLEQAQSGPVRWAVDGATALSLHGLACESPAVGVVVELDGAARAWLTAGLMRCTAPCSDVGGWSSWSLEEVQAYTRELVVGRYGILALRAVARLPAVVQLRPEGAERCYPVVSVDEVERTQPQHAEVLARLRARRSAAPP